MDNQRDPQETTTQMAYLSLPLLVTTLFIPGHAQSSSNFRVLVVPLFEILAHCFMRQLQIYLPNSGSSDEVKLGEWDVRAHELN